MADVNLPGNWKQIFSCQREADGTTWTVTGLGTDGAIWCVQRPAGATWGSPFRLSGPVTFA